MSHPITSEQILLVQRPVGLPDIEKVFKYKLSVIPKLCDGEVLIRVIYLSLDPAMRGWMNEGKSYIPPVKIGDVMRASGIGEVIDSNSSKYATGDFVSGLLGWTTYAVAKEHEISMIPKEVLSIIPLPTFMSALGMTGMTAYFGLLDIGQPKKGETVVVSGAAGATGLVVGQIAKLLGCYVVGIAGSDDKCQMLREELKFDATVNYTKHKKPEDFFNALKVATPNGIDIYFDNVGGYILDECLRRLNFKARVVICGMISQYNSVDTWKGPANLRSLLVNRAKMEGFIVFDYKDRFPEAYREMSKWIVEKKLISKETVISGGIKQAPHALLDLFTGKNTGKLLLKIGNDPFNSKL